MSTPPPLGLTGGGGGGGGKILIMNVLVPNSPGGERTGEMSQTILVWNDLSAPAQNRLLNKFADPNSGVQLDFDAEEAKRLNDLGRFNSMQLGGFAGDLTGATTNTFVDDDEDVMTNIFATFKPSAHGIPDGTRVGTVFPGQIASILKKVVTPA